MLGLVVVTQQAAVTASLAARLEVLELRERCRTGRHLEVHELERPSCHLGELIRLIGEACQYPGAAFSGLVEQDGRTAVRVGQCLGCQLGSLDLEVHLDTPLERGPESRELLRLQFFVRRNQEDVPEVFDVGDDLLRTDLRRIVLIIGISGRVLFLAPLSCDRIDVEPEDVAVLATAPTFVDAINSSRRTILQVKQRRASGRHQVRFGLLELIIGSRHELEGRLQLVTLTLTLLVVDRDTFLHLRADLLDAV